MTGEEAGFLRAICEAPEDDTPRLIFADWLDEHDQPERALYIRMEIDLACRVPSGKGLTHYSSHDAELMAMRDEERLIDLRRRVMHFTIEYGWGKLDPTPIPLGVTVTRTRGFISEITCRCETFRDQAAALFRTAPIERVTLSDLQIVETDREPGFRNRWYVPWIHGRSIFNLPPVLQRAIIDCRADTKEELLDAISALCVNHGRNLVGLPPVDSCEADAGRVL